MIPSRKRRDRNVVIVEKIETEGDRQLKHLLQTQLEVQGTFSEQLSRCKDFSSPSMYEEPNVSGQYSLHEFEQIAKREKRVEELRFYQLNQDEIQLVLHHESNEAPDEPLEKRSKVGVDPQVKAERLRVIYNKMKVKDTKLAEKDQFQGIKHLTRHEMELEKALGTKSSNPLNRIILDQNKETRVQESDSKVVSLLKDLEARVSNTAYRNQNTDTDIELSSEESTLSEGSVNKTVLSEKTCKECGKLKERDIIGPLERNDLVRYEVCHLCRQKSGGEEIGLPGHNNIDAEVDDCAESLGKKIILSKDASIPESVIAKYRLSIDDIRQLPRFADYSPGEPNKTLYVKNLSNNVVEQDLPALFMKYQTDDSEKIVFKLLKGRMRGQAFVTFPDVETATRALQFINGYHFKGKPIIIQYANKH